MSSYNWPPEGGGGGGSGDVVGPASSTNNAAARFDGTTGKLIQNSGVIIDDSDNVSGIANLTITGTATFAAALTGVAKITAGVLSVSNVDLASEVTGDLPVANLDGGTNASASTFWRGDGAWATPAGGGDVSGPGASTDNALAVWDGLSGTVLKDSSVLISTVVTLAGTQTLTNKTIAAGDNTITGLTNTNLSGSAAITNANLATMAANTIKGNNTGGATVPDDLTATEVTAMLDNFVGDSGAGGTKGLVPAPAAGDAAAGRYLDADGTWSVPAGAGDVVGPASATDNAIARFDDTTGKLLQNSVVTIGDTGNVAGVADFTATGTTTLATSLTGVLKAASGVVSASYVDLATEVTGDLPVTNLDGGTNADSTTFWRGDGSWATPAGSGGGVASVAPTSVKTTNYTVDGTADNGATVPVSTDSGAVTVTLPASPSDGFKTTVKDYGGNSTVNTITVDPNGNLMDGEVGSDIINAAFGAVTYHFSSGLGSYIRITQASFASIAGRALFAGGSTGSVSDVIDYVAIPVLSNATDFGDLTIARFALGACASSTRAVFGGGDTGTNNPSNTTDYVTILSASNATDFGDLTVSRYGVAACGSSTRGVFGGGYDGSAYRNAIDYYTIATTGNATSFGNLTVSRNRLGALSSPTRGIFGGGNDGSNLNTIDYITIASTGNATSFGSLTVARRGCPGTSNATRGLFGGGDTGSNSNVIDYVTIATTSNAIDFGDLTVARTDPAAASNTTRAIFGGGTTGTPQTVIDYVSFGTLSNASNFGNLSVGRNQLAATSNSNGGL
jgi:hypothetical protein